MSTSAALREGKRQRLIQQARRLRYEHGLPTVEVARRCGRSVPWVWRHAPGRPGKVPNDRARAIFLASGLSAPEVARRIGWFHSPGRDHQGDGSRLKRTLGLLPEYGGHKPQRTYSPRLTADAEALGLIVEACGAAAWEAMPDEDSVAA